MGANLLVENSLYDGSDHVLACVTQGLVAKV